MKSVGFVISGKENERRRALLPQDLRRVKNRDCLVFEQGYATHLGISDHEYTVLGCMVKPRVDVYTSDVVCNPKAPLLDEQPLFRTGQTLFGWLHAVQSRATTDFLLERGMRGIAWEDMYENNRHCFWRNNELAGEAAVLHALRYTGQAPTGLAAAIVGRGNCARGAYRTLAQLGAKIVTYDRRTVSLLREEVGQYDIVVNAVMWDVFRTDHILYERDLAKMRPGAMIIDISCDEHMGIETSRATTIGDPVYVLAGIIHYVVDHAPAIYYRTATEAISQVVAEYVDQLVEDTLSDCLKRATIIATGRIVDPRIATFQGR